MILRVRKITMRGLLFLRMRLIFWSESHNNAKPWKENYLKDKMPLMIWQMRTRDYYWCQPKSKTFIKLFHRRILRLSFMSGQSLYKDRTFLWWLIAADIWCFMINDLVNHSSADHHSGFLENIDFNNLRGTVVQRAKVSKD